MFKLSFTLLFMYFLLQTLFQILPINNCFVNLATYGNCSIIYNLMFFFISSYKIIVLVIIITSLKYLETLKDYILILRGSKLRWQPLKTTGGGDVTYWANNWKKIVKSQKTKLFKNFSHFMYIKAFGVIFFLFFL